MTEVDAVLDRWSELFAKRDAAGLAKLYTVRALFYGGTPQLRRGQADIEAYFQPLKSLAQPAVSFSEVALETVAPGAVDMACVATFEFGGTQVRGRLTWTLVEQEGGWRIASHHASPTPEAAG